MQQKLLERFLALKPCTGGGCGYREDRECGERSDDDELGSAAIRLMCGLVRMLLSSWACGSPG
jgi:hypothetical protein